MNKTSDYSALFQLACRAFKYYLLSALGFSVACLLATILGGFDIVVVVLPIIGIWLLRLATINGCLLAVAVIVESMRH